MLEYRIQNANYTFEYHAFYSLIKHKKLLIPPKKLDFTPKKIIHLKPKKSVLLPQKKITFTQKKNLKVVLFLLLVKT